VSADLRITRCTDLTCSSAVSTTVDGGPHQVGEFASIAVGAEDVPIVAYGTRPPAPSRSHAAPTQFDAVEPSVPLLTGTGRVG
jgi:hypothetical protein